MEKVRERLTLVPSSALPPWKFGHVNWEIILYRLETEQSKMRYLSVKFLLQIEKMLDADPDRIHTVRIHNPNKNLAGEGTSGR
jgi:hypothetical protein